MKSITDVLKEYSNKKNNNLYGYLKISEKWNIIMGDVLSKICYPSFFRNGVLTVNVIDSVWANEIIMNKIKIFNNIKYETNIIVYNLVTRIDEVNSFVNNIENKKEEYSKSFISEEHKNWAKRILEESKIEDKKMREMFYNTLLEIDED